MQRALRGRPVSGCGSCTSTTCSSSSSSSTVPLLRGRVMVVAQAGERPPARGYTVKMQRQRRSTNNTEALVRTAQSLSRQQQPQVRLVPQQQQGQQQQGQRQQQELFGGSNSRQQPDASTSDRPDFAWPALPSGLGNWLDSIPARYRVVVATAVCFAICNMDKVNMSVAIIPMAQYFGWSASVSGLVQSSFFYGFLLTQLPGGYLSSKIGGRRVLPAGATLWSLATCAVPLIGSTVPGLCVSRAAVGFGEAVAPSAAIDMVSRIMPADERARSVSTVFSGLHVGTIVGLLTAPWLIQHLGWQAVFYIYGGLGLVWAMMFEAMMASIQRTEPDLVAALEGDKSKMVSATAGTSLAGAAGAAGSAKSAQPAAAGAGAYGEKPSGNVPWRAFLRCAPLRNLAFVHFCNQWPTYTLMAWLPTYLVDTLSVDLMHAAQTSLLPPMAAIAASATAGPAADSLIRKGLPVGLVRKCAQGIAFLGPAACLTLATTPAVADVPALTVAALTAAIGLGAFSLAGLYCTHGDLSAKYSSVLLGLTKTPACLPGIFGVTLVGYLYDQTQSWELSLFAPAIFFTTLGALVYTFACSNDPVDFDEEDNSPFAFESRLPSWLRFGGGAESDNKA